MFVLFCLLNVEEIFNMKRARSRSTAASDPGKSTPQVRRLTGVQVINAINPSDDEEDYKDAYPSSDNENVNLDLSDSLEET